MWDRPDILNGAASTLFAAAFLLVAYAAVHYAVRLPFFALREVRITHELAHVTPEQVETIVRRELQGNFFTLDLARARAGFEKLPWVRNVNVRRQWPDRLDVTFEEHVALGRWGSAALVNTYGEIFAAAYDGTPASSKQGSRLGDANDRASGAVLSHAGVASVSGDTSPKGAAAPPAEGDLPLFVGPPGSAKEIAIQYGYFQRSLGVIGLAPVQVRVSARRAWQVRLAGGIALELGRENVEARLDRFIAVYPRTVGRLQRRISYVDLRYSNGFAVGIPELAREQPDKSHSRKPARATG
jgi:cell division protein FtsQ